VKRIVAGLAATLALFVNSIAPAGAATTVTPVTGEITCKMDGIFKFSPLLPDGNSDGARGRTRVKITAKMHDCDDSQVSGGKTAITGGTVSANGFLDEGASCYDLAFGDPPDFTFNLNKLDLKWTGTGANGRGSPTVAHSKTFVSSTGDFLFGAWQYWSDAFRDNDAFAGQWATLTMGIENIAAINDCALGVPGAKGKPTRLSAVTFSAARGSKVVVNPA
jgi:hypothetical protein